MGQLNIKDQQLIAEARELAGLMGTSTTAALREAVRDRLGREKRERDADRRAEDALAIAGDIRRHMTAPMLTRQELDAMLYDPETGLPR